MDAVRDRKQLDGVQARLAAPTRVRPFSGNWRDDSKGVYHINLNGAGLAAVQDWINNPSHNYGIIIKDYNVSRAVGVSTSEAKTASQRPKLTINYTTPPVNVAPTVNVGTDTDRSSFRAADNRGNRARRRPTSRRTADRSVDASLRAGNRNVWRRSRREYDGHVRHAWNLHIAAYCQRQPVGRLR